jgi:hypothetical protein
MAGGGARRHCADEAFGEETPVGSMWRIAAGVLSVAAAAVALSACSTKPAHSNSTTTTTRPPASTTTSSSSTTTTVANTKCQLSGLKIAVKGQGGAAGTQELTFSLTNTSAAACKTYGYPGLLLVSTSGATVWTTTEVHGGGVSFENIAASTVTITPGQAAYFNVGFSDVTTAGTTCSTTHSIQVIPPTNTTHAMVAVAQGIHACDNGTLHTSAIFSSTNSTATQTTAP